MLIAIVVGLAIQAEPAPAPISGPPQNSNDTTRERRSPLRWLLSAHAGRQPFLVAWSSNRDFDLAVRSVVDPGRQRPYFVVMRQTDQGLEEADSRECAFEESMEELRGLSPPELSVPELRSPSAASDSVFAHETSSITVFGARQENGDLADVTWTSSNGDLGLWVRRLYERTKDCWKPTI